MKKLEQEPNCSEIPTGSTTKNDLGVDCISRADVLKLMQDNWHTHNGDWAMQESMDDIRALPSVTPQEPTTKNDLEVDAISRVQAQTEIEMNASRYTIAKERGGMGQVEWSDQLIKVSDAVNIIRALPPATPQEPRKGHWILRNSFLEPKCSECNYESERYNFCPNCGAKMVEPQESEDKE